MDKNNGLLAANVATAANMVSNLANIDNQFKINKYNNDVNRQNMIYQNAVAAANETESRIYNSPIEQLRRLTSAGVNAFTARDMLDSGNGSSSGSAGAAASNAVASPVTFDLSAMVDAMSRLDEMHFTNDQNRQAAREAMDQLMTNIRSQIDLQGNTIAEAQRAQKAQFDWQDSANVSQNKFAHSENELNREQQKVIADNNNKFAYATAVLSDRAQRDINDANIGFQRWNAEEQRQFQSYWNEAQSDFQAEENEKQRQFQSDENAENRFLQNWTSESTFSVGPFEALGWKVKDNLDQRYKGRVKDMDKEVIKGFIGD